MSGPLARRAASSTAAAVRTVHTHFTAVALMAIGFVRGKGNNTQ